MSRRVVITGMGAVTPLGTGVDKFWDGVKANRIGFSFIDKFDTERTGVKIAGIVRDFNEEDYFGVEGCFDKKEAKRMDQFTKYALVAAHEALTDADTDFSDLDPIYEPLAANKADFVTGDRFAGQMERGAMSLSHRLGVPFLSWCGRVRFGVTIHDWHCGLRGIRRDALARLDLRTDGMEFATEMIAQAARAGLRIAEVSVPLRVSPYDRQEKLRTIRDGLRHLRFIVRG